MDKKIMNSNEDSRWSVGPPFVSPRVVDEKPLSAVTPPCEGSPEDKDLIIEALTVRMFVEAGEWPEWFMRKHGLPEQFEDLPGWLQQAIRSEYTIEYMREFGLTSALVEPSFREFPRLASRLVKDDHWTDLLNLIIKDGQSRGYRLTNSVVASPDVEFVEAGLAAVPCYDKIISALDEGFDEKYYWKMIRPVAKVMKWLSVEPSASAIFHEVLQDYPHPGHWSTPSGHFKAAEATGLLVPDLFENADPVWVSDAVMGCKVWPYFRVFSFMHISSENK